MLFFQKGLCFSHFSSIYEFLGGASIALAGLTMISEEYINKYSLKYLSGETNRRIDLLALEIKQFKFAHASLTEVQSDFRYAKMIEKSIKEIDKFLLDHRLRDFEEEQKVFKKLFIQSAIWSIFFTLSFLVIGGLEQSQSWLGHYEFDIFIWYYFEILLFSSLLLILTNVRPSLTNNHLVRWIGKITYVNVFGIFISFVLGATVPLIMTNFYPNLFSYLDWLVILLSFLSCAAVIPFYIYRYHIYLRVKMRSVDKRIDHYIIVIYKLKRIHRKNAFRTISQNKFEKNVRID